MLIDIVDIYVVCANVAGSEVFPIIAFKTKEEAEEHIRRFGDSYGDGNCSIQVIGLSGDGK